MALIALANAPIWAQVPGDANGDGSLSVTDVDLVMGHLLGKSLLSGDALVRADANGDGLLDLADFLFIQSGPLPPLKVFMLPGGVPLFMAKIPHGSFQMGAPQSDVDLEWSYSTEQPRHPVTIAADFYMGRFEVTQRQWIALMASNPSFFQPSSGTIEDPIPEDLDRPVERVSWTDIQGFEAALNALGFGGGFSLPSEAQWEYAARGGTQTRYPFGDSTCSPGFVGCGNDCDLSQYAWWCGNNGDLNPYGTKKVGLKLPNPFGLYDTMGNVYEFCEDYFHASFDGAPADGSAWLSPPSAYRVLKGGSWLNIASYCLPAGPRNNPEENYSTINLGFRIAWNP